MAEPGTDHACAEVKSWSAPDGLELGIGGQRFTFATPVVIDAPAPFEAWGVGGILSLQQLHPGATLVLDLRADRLSLVEGSPSQVSSWVAQSHPELEPIVLQRRRGVGDAESLVIVEGRVEPSAPVQWWVPRDESGRAEKDCVAQDAAARVGSLARIGPLAGRSGPSAGQGRTVAA